MGSVLLASILSFSVSFFMIPVIIRMAVVRSLMDLPDHRKIHTHPTPSMGGIALFVSVLLTLLLVIDFEVSPQIAGFLAAMTIIFLVGLKDDIFFITPYYKFIGQFLAVVLFLSLSQYRLDSFDGFMGIQSLSPVVAFLFSALTMLVIINAINLIDGVDGLAGLMGVSTLSFLGVAFWMKGDMVHLLVTVSVFFALFAFLIYNWSPAKIFLGDTGSLVLGFVSAVLVVRFISLYAGSEATSVISVAPAIGFALFFMPMADLLRLFIVRIVQGKSPFEPDMQHLHHHLLRMGLSHRMAAIVMVVTNTLFVAYSLLLQELGNTLLILSMFVIATFLYLGLKKISTKTGSPVVETHADQTPVETIARIINRDSFEEVNILQ